MLKAHNCAAESGPLLRCFKSDYPQNFPSVFIKGPISAVAMASQNEGCKNSATFCPLVARSMCEINLEAELFTLQDSNAKLVAALQEANSSVEQWKKQLAEYQEETDRLREQVTYTSLTSATLCYLE